MADALRALIALLPDRRRDAIARRTTSRGCRTRRRPSTRSTASSRSTWTRAASRARGKRSSSTSTTRRPRRSGRSPRTRSGSRITCRGIRDTARAGVHGVTANAIDVVDRDRGVGADHADRHQPAERSGDPRALRQQVGVAVERQRGLRRVDAAGVPERVRVDAGGGRARARSGARSPAS